MQLLKSVVDYKIKTADFEKKLYETTKENSNNFSVKQLEVVVWAISKRMQSEFQKPLSDEAR